MPVQFNVPDARNNAATTQSLNASRVERILSANTLDEAQRMGVFDKIKDFFRGGIKAEAIRYLYDQVTAPQPHQAQPTDMLHRFEHLRRLAIEDHQTQFVAAVQSGADPAQRQWGFSFSVGDHQIYQSPVLTDEWGSYKSDFVQANALYEGINASVQRFRNALRQGAEASQGADRSGAGEVAALADGTISEPAVQAIRNLMGDDNGEATPAEMFAFVKDLKPSHNPYLASLAAETIGEVSLLSLCLPGQGVEAGQQTRIDNALDAITTELLNKVREGFADAERLLPPRTLEEFARSNTQDLVDSNQQRQFILDNLENPLFSRENFRRIEPGDTDATFKAVFQAGDGVAHVLELSNRVSSSGEYRGEYVQSILKGGNYGNLREALSVGFMGHKDPIVVSASGPPTVRAAHLLGLTDASDLLALLRHLQKYGPADLAQKTFDALRSTTFAGTNALALLMNESASAAAQPGQALGPAAPLPSAELEALRQLVAVRTRAIEPEVSGDRLQALTNTALHQYQALVAFANGDEEEGLQAFARSQAFLQMADPDKGPLLRMAVGQLSLEQQVRAYEAIQGSSLIGEIMSFDMGAVLRIDSPYDNRLTREYQSIGLLFSMNNELKVMRETLNGVLGLSDEWADLHHQFSPQTLVLSYALLNAANRFRLEGLKSAIQYQMSVDMLGRQPLKDLSHALPPRNSPDPRLFKMAYQSMASEPGEMKMPNSQNISVTHSMGDDGSSESSGISLAGRNRLDQLQAAAKQGMARYGQQNPVSPDWDQAQNDARLQRFILDANTGIEFIEGEKLSAIATGEPRWKRWDDELKHHFPDPTERDNARTELTQLLTQDTLVDLTASTDNLDAYGWVPTGLGAQVGSIRIEGRDPDGYLRVVFSNETPVSGLLVGDRQNALPRRLQGDQRIDYQFCSMVRYKPSNQPGTIGDIRFDRHLARYDVSAGER